MSEKLKLNDSIYILKESDDIYQVIFTGTRRIKKFRVDSLVKEIISKLNSEKTEFEIVNGLKDRYNPEKISSCLNSLESEGVVRRYNERDNYGRYSKQILFIDELTDSWEETLKLQRQIEESTISVFGIGGIGTWIVNGLSQIGVGKIRITDPDKVNESNLNRQLFFNISDIGEYKVDVIKSKLPDTKIFTSRKTVSKSENLEDLVKGVDFLVNCADSPSIVETTNVIDEYASKYNIPYCVAGGYNMHLGMVGPIIIPGKTASFGDFIEYQRATDPIKNLEVVKEIEQTGSLGPICGVVANIQVMEIFKYLIGKGEANLNKFAEIDFMNFKVDWKNFSP